MGWGKEELEPTARREQAHPFTGNGRSKGGFWDQNGEELTEKTGEVSKHQKLRWSKKRRKGRGGTIPSPC